MLQELLALICKTPYQEDVTGAKLHDAIIRNKSRGDEALQAAWAEFLDHAQARCTTDEDQLALNLVRAEIYWLLGDTPNCIQALMDVAAHARQLGKTDIETRAAAIVEDASSSYPTAYETAKARFDEEWSILNG